MHETQTPQYTSRRERRNAERVYTRRETSSLRHANEYMQHLKAMNDIQQENGVRWPGLPTYTFVDRDGRSTFDDPEAGKPVDLRNALMTQEDIITNYQSRIDAGDWNVINDLDQRWRNEQPSEEESAVVYAEAEGTIRTRISKVSSFITRKVIGARQHWLNQETLRIDAPFHPEYRTQPAARTTSDDHSERDSYARAA